MKNNKEFLYVITTISAIIIMLLFLFGCTTNVTVTPTSIKVDGNTFYIYDMDGCQYIASSVGLQSGLFTHKGNCKYCIERARGNK